MTVPRRERKRSATGIYHVMMRGINQQNIFDDDEDCAKMMQTLADVKAVSRCGILAYCLMGNHCHFLLKEENESIDQIIKRIGARYVYWYNVKYKRSGHLFQDRYKSETVENDVHLLSVVRYIHQNPLKAGLCDRSLIYRWSSFGEYVGQQNIVDSAIVLGLVNGEEFEEFHKKEDEEAFLDNKKPLLRFTDEEARGIIKKISNCSSVAEFQQNVTAVQRHYIKSFKESGISIRQINRLTGVSRGVVERS